jgi:ubiquinone/menaquinone biosynthesis C-methylase UbiE
MPDTGRTFTPAAGRDWLLPFYDFFTKLLGVEAVHRRIIEQSAIQPGYRLLEIGCGTGNLSILAKKLYPSVEAVGIDPDPKALSIARKKARRAGVGLEFQEAFSEQLPFPDTSFDRVLSAFMLHHIQPETKITALREAYRIIKPGGALLLADFEGGEHPRGLHSRRLHHQNKPTRFHHTISFLLGEAGFAGVRMFHQQSTMLGRVAYYTAGRTLDH